MHATVASLVGGIERPCAWVDGKQFNPATGY